MYAFANIAASTTDAVVVPAVQGFRIQVRKFIAECGGVATNITFNSKPANSGAGVACSMTFQNGVNGGEVLPDDLGDDGWFETKVGESLTATTGAGSQTGVQVVYKLLPGKG